MNATVCVSYIRNHTFLNCRNPCIPKFSVTRSRSLRSIVILLLLPLNVSPYSNASPRSLTLTVC